MRTRHRCQLVSVKCISLLVFAQVMVVIHYYIFFKSLGENAPTYILSR